MCGIVGYIGENQAVPVLLNGLSKLEYRGYDSAGISVYHDGIHTIKVKGKLAGLREKVEKDDKKSSHIGIGHTRWATHGVPNEINSHPHNSQNGKISVVHNGIIENYLKLKHRLESKGYEFVSETDTEVIAHLLDYYYDRDPLEAITKVMHRMEGSYALGIIFADHPEEMYAVRKDSPLIVGHTKDGSIIASDVPAVLKYTRDVVFIQNEEIVKLTEDKLEFYNIDEEVIEKETTHIDWDVNAAEKGGYEHFMLKEMYEQPKAILDTFSPRIKGNEVVIDELGMSDDEIRAVKKIMIVACGSAYHAGVTGKYIFEGLTRIPVEVDTASEFRYRDPIIEDGTLLIVISQSGETADSLAAIREAHAKGGKVLGIVNVVGSSIAREADNVMYTWAGPEIAVATTKAYSCQLIAEYLLAMKFAHVRGKISDAELADMIEDMKELPAQVEMLLNNKKNIQKFANRYLAAKDIFYIGRGIDYAIAMEGSLKMKEISYVHSDAYAAGELKHGTISLIEDGILVVGVATQAALFEKTISNMVEVKSRGAYLMGLTTYGNYNIEDTADFAVYVPQTESFFATSLAIVPLQLMGYYVSVAKGLDVDKPRNLAKSVTVE